MAALPILLAAGFDWLEALLPLLFVFIWIISQVLSVVRRLAAGRREDDDDEDDEDENDFSDLIGRQRNGTRRCPGCGQQFAAPAAAIMACPDCGRLTLDESVADSDMVDDLPVRSDRETLEAEIRAFLGHGRKPPPLPQPRQPERPPAESMAAMLAAGRAERGNDEIAEHIHDVFDKGLERLPEGVVESPWIDLGSGQAGGRSAAADIRGLDAAGIRSAAADLVSMLKNPATIRQAVLLREVLDRPTDRWQ